MKYNEKVERYAPKLGRKNLANGLSCPPFVYMDDSDDGMWVHYCKYCENIAKQKYKRCLALHDYCLCELEFAFRDPCIERSVEGCVRWRKWANLWLELAEKFKEVK